MKKLITKLTGREKLLTICLLAVLSFGLLTAFVGLPILGAWRGWNKANINNYQQLVLGPSDTYTRGLYFFNRGTTSIGFEIENDDAMPIGIDIDNDGTMTVGLNIDNVSIANPAAPGYVMGVNAKASATTAAQANTTLISGEFDVDIDHDVASATGLYSAVTRDGTSDSAGAVYGAYLSIDYEDGAAMTCDAWTLYVTMDGTNATTGASRVACFFAQVGTTEVVEVENDTGMTTTNMLMIDANGTATNGILIDNDGTMTTGLTLEGTITTGIDMSGAALTTDIILENSDTITNPDADTIKVSDKFCLENDECFDNVNDGTVALNGDIDSTNSGQIAGTWYVDDAAQNQTDSVMDTGGSATYSNTEEIVMVRAGSVIGIGCFGNDDVTTDDFQFDVTIDGTKTGLISKLDTVSLATHVNTQAKDTDTFTAGQRIGIKWTSLAGALPTGTTDYTCTVLVEQ